MRTLTRVKILGVGGAGNNAVTRLSKLKLAGAELIAINTDIQDLQKTKADVKLRIGRQTTQGLGTGMNPELGRSAAQEQKNEIEDLVKDSDLVFLAAGLGGGTGSGALPLIAQLCRDQGILTMTVVTKPFSFEGSSRMNIAKEAIKNLTGRVDCLLVLDNDKLILATEKNTPLAKAFLLADEILHQAVVSILDLVLRPSLVSISFADVRTCLKNSGPGFFGQGLGQGQSRSQEAVARALNSPLLEISP